jgi:DNA-binding transcriptional LysR family regulator
MLRFTLAQIEAFSYIVEAGSFLGAARKLNLTQPTISQRIRELESAIGVPLFTRHGPRVQLTPEGHALVEYSRRLIGTATEMTRHLRNRDPLKGVLRLGVSNSFALVCMSDLLRRLQQSYPALKTSVRVNDSRTMTLMMENQELDVAILVEPIADPRIQSQPAGRSELAWMASSSLHLPRVLHPSDLAELHVMVPPAPSRLYSSVIDWFAAAAVEPTRVSTSNNFAVNVQTVVDGLAIGVLPLRMMQDEIGRGLIRPLKVAPPIPPHYVSICHQTGVLGPGVEAVVALMHDLIIEHRLYE